ncbi:hypothetical protein MKW98_002433 [Papaver atlanticum]|uniref:RRM domain-containing protein n=1 Tax=Papaver atlanticum TaxID=357466 RepID=A0AAD4SB91_9MAGN|nr:hypothetical protein MKW98_002433 [Papaver atlanticum]
MASATTSLIKPLSMATSLSTHLTTKTTSYPSISFPSKSVKVSQLSTSFSSWVPLKNKTSSSNMVTFVASDFAQVTEEDGDEIETPGGDGGFVEEESSEETYAEPCDDAKLFVGNLPYDIDSEKLANLFDQAGVVEVAEVIYNRETDESRGFAFVTMSSVEEAEKAVEMFNRYDINGRTLNVNKASPKGSRPERTPRSFGSSSSLRLYVGNLSWQVDDARLEQVFSEHGKVMDAKVVMDRETGRSRGFGFVTMSAQSELDDAIAALDGQSLDGRMVRVNVAEQRPPRRNF